MTPEAHQPILRSSRIRSTELTGVPISWTAPALAVAMSVTGIALLALVGASAPNNNTLRAPITLLRLPPMPDLTAELATYAAIALSSLGLLGMLAAHDRGWRPSPRRLFLAAAAAVLVVANLTPVGSSDTASYAAYGRIAALGGDPYVTTPAQLGGDYAHLVSAVWQHTPSVYGPIATWWQASAAFVGGHRPWLTIWALMLANGAVFLLTGYVLMRTSADPVRAGLLWLANPLLITVLAAGGHLDTMVAFFTVCALHRMRTATHWRDDLLAGALVGLACGVKVSAALLGAALGWALVRERAWGRLTRQAIAAIATLAVLYAGYGLHALAPLAGASQLISTPSLWAVLRHFTSSATILWPVLMLALAWLLHRGVPRETPAAIAVPFALTFAWILVAPWAMPWYTAIVWAVAAVCLRGPMVRWLTMATAILALCHNSGGHGWIW